MDEFLESKVSTLAAIGAAAFSLLLALVALVFAWDVQQDWQDFQAEADLGRQTQVDSMRGGSVVMEALSNADFGVEIDVDETVPLNAQVPFQQEFTIPIRTVVAIQETVNTTIEVPGFFGDTRVPVAIPLDINLPVEVDVPFVIDETIDLSSEVPLELTVPLQIDLSSTTLGSLASQYGERLDAAAAVLEGRSTAELSPAPDPASGGITIPDGDSGADGDPGTGDGSSDTSDPEGADNRSNGTVEDP